MSASSLVRALAMTAALAASCRGAAVPLSPYASGASPFGPFAATTPALSLAGAAHFVCLERRARRILPVHFGADTSYALTSGEMGEAVIRGASCTRYTVQLTLPLPLDEATASPIGLRESAAVLESLRVPHEHGALRDLADYLRLSAREPFVYGAETWISDSENVQLRFDPMQGDARLMVQYQLGL